MNLSSHSATTKRVQARALQPGQVAIPGVKNLIGVAAGKGGVGKSTVAVGVAKALARQGASVGVMDVDVYGPSVPHLLGLDGLRAPIEGKRFVPLETHGLKMQSIACLVEDQDPLIWRGPMASKAVEQLAYQTLWGDLDYLVVDLPPGTGDIALTTCKKLPLTAATLVTIPHPLACLDLRRCHAMMRKMAIPVLGLVENMAYVPCAHGPDHRPWGEHHLDDWVLAEGIKVVSSLPFDQDLHNDHPDLVSLWDALAAEITAGLSYLPVRRGVSMPPVVAA